jgi:hypothetical protein
MGGPLDEATKTKALWCDMIYISHCLEALSVEHNRKFCGHHCHSLALVTSPIIEMLSKGT